MAEFQTVVAQLAFLRDLLGEPANEDDARWNPTQLVRAINDARRWVCEETRSFQIKDSQQTNPGGVVTKIYQTPFDLIGFYKIEWNGVPLDLTTPAEWREKVGEDEDIQGDPYVVMYFARQLQLFYVPQTAKTLLYRGWGYTEEVVATGNDTQFTDAQARTALYRASWKLKGADERDVAEDKGEARSLAAEIAKQFKPKGARYVKSPYIRSPISGLYGLR